MVPGRPVRLGPFATTVEPFRPDLCAAWDFSRPSPLSAFIGDCVLLERAGNVKLAPPGLGQYGCIRLRHGQWLEAAPSSALYRSGTVSQVSVLAWLKRNRKAENECEFLAGVWNETDSQRQYGLFLNLAIHESGHQVGGHISSTGGPSIGSPWCLEAAIGATAVSYDEWHGVAFTYDGSTATCYLDGKCDERPSRNPASFPGGLCLSNSPFTVGAVSRSGKMGNWFCGDLGGLAVFHRALFPEEMAQLTQIRSIP